MRAAASVAVLLLAGCTAPNELYHQDSEDGGVTPVDLSVVIHPVDLRGGGTVDLAEPLSCDRMVGLMTAYLNNSTSCRTDAECTLAKTACGLPAACGDVYVNTGWRTDEVEQILKGWSASKCGPSSCPCPGKPIAAPACNNGACGPKRTSTGAVGDACTSPFDCLSFQCITEAEDKLYTGGYCSFKGCSDVVRCPSGSTCRGLSNGSRVCLQDCKSATDCRTGYGCCPATGRDMGWCSPSKSTLCLGG